MKKLFTLAFLCLFALNSFAQELGTLNAEFGTDGAVVFDPTSSHDFMYKVLVQEDGKIITVGRARLDSKNYSIYVSRHNADGTLDDMYGDGGYVFLKVDPLIYLNSAYDADLGEDGYLYITGYTYDYTNNTAFVICLDENGFENEDYGDKGYVVSEYGGGIVYEAIDIDAKGRPVVTGYIDDNILVRRYNAKGKIDKTFGDNGSAIIKLDPSPLAWSYAYDIEILDNGKMLLTGHKVSEDMLYESYLLRLNSNGDLDATFADNGLLILNAGDYAEYATSISVQADGKYLVGGHADLFTTEPLPRSGAHITRVNADGTIDETFGTDGFVRLEPFEGDGCINETYSILAAEDGQIFGTVFSYNCNTGASRAYVYNLDANGQFKEDFAGSGIMALPRFLEDEMNVRSLSLALQNNKRLLVGGYVSDTPSDQQLFLACINVDIKDNSPETPDDDAIEELTSSLLLYPNPVNDKLNIVTEVEIEEVVVYDALGRQQDNKVTRQQGNMTIDVAGLNTGVYFVMIKTNDDVVMKQFVKK